MFCVPASGETLTDTEWGSKFKECNSEDYEADPCKLFLLFQLILLFSTLFRLSIKGSVVYHRNHTTRSSPCRLGLLLHKPKARARVGLVFGLSPQSRPWVHKPGQACKSPSPQYKARAWPEPAFYRPNPALTRSRIVLFFRRDKCEKLSAVALLV
jgi:hypothetical protein